MVECVYVLPEGLSERDLYIVRLVLSVLECARATDAKVDRMSQILEHEKVISQGSGAYIRDDLLNELTV